MHLPRWVWRGRSSPTTPQPELDEAPQPELDEAAGPLGCDPGAAPPSNSPNPLQKDGPFEGNDSRTDRRWASVFRLVRYATALVSLTWFALPQGLRAVLVERVLR